MKAFILLACIVVVYSSTNFDAEYLEKYDNNSVYQIFIETEAHMKLIKRFESSLSLNLDYWVEYRGPQSSIQVMVNPKIKPLFENLLKTAQMKYTITINDVASLIKNQIKLNEKKDDTTNNILNFQQHIQHTEDSFDYSKYHTLDDINQWMKDLKTQYPELVTVFNVSKSYEGRDIYAFKISTTPTTTNKPALWFDGGIHAREWIAPATVMYIANVFLTNHTSDKEIAEILNNFDIYILPVFNVDGYVYTWAKDRNWRKTRSKTIVPGCIGVDPNRNWNAHWCEQGASKDPCSDSYCGPRAFSEPELKGVADFLTAHKDTIVCYINFHSFSQLWMSPWGWTTELPPDFKQQDGGSIVAVNALSQLYGTKYGHGNIASTIYLASGSSADWTYDVLKIKYSYGVELRDTGEFGFLLPPDQIIPSGLETFEALKALAFYIKSQ